MVSGRVNGDSEGRREFRRGGRAVVAREAICSISGDGGDDAGGVIDLADAIVSFVGDEQVSGRVDRDS